MAGNLQERIDFALNYQVEGQGSLEKGASSLENIEEKNERVKKSLDQARKSWQQNSNEMKDAQKIGKMTEEMQQRLGTAVSSTNERVRDAQIGMELLKLEYQEGSISQEEYTQGIQELRSRLEGADVLTLSQVRALRQLSQAQRQANLTTNQMTRTVTGSGPAFTSFAQILQDLPFGLIAISNNIPFAASQFQNLTLRTGGAGAALRAVMGVISGPGGILVLLTSLVPALAVASQRMDLFNTSLIDGKAAGEAYNSVLQSIIENITTIEGFEAEAPFNTNQLEQQLRLWENVREQNEQTLETLKEEQLVLTDMAISGRLIGQFAVRHENILKEVEARENNIEQANDRIEKLKAEILSNEILLTDEVTKRLALEQQADPLFEARLKLLEKANEKRIGGLEEVQRIAERDRQVQREHIERIDQMRVEAQQRLIEGFKRRRQLQEEARRRELEFQRLIANPPSRQREEINEGPAIQRALTQQMLAEDARMSLIRDSVSREKFVRLQMQRQFEQERLDLIRQGISDEQSLDNLRILQEQELQDELNRIQQEKQDARLTLWANYEAAVQGFGQAIVEGSAKSARQTFEMNKALNLAMAIASGARAVVESLPNIPLAISVGAMAAAQIAKIASTQFKGGRSQSGAADRPQIAYRGIQADTVQGAAVNKPQTMNVPDTVRLVDSAGNLLTKLEWERDKEGGSAYIKGK